MPSFSPFRTLTPFPKPATKQEVLYLGTFGAYGNNNISTSTLNTYQQSIPFWWLLYKVSFSADWTVTIGDIGSFSGSFGVEFLVNPTSPNARICTENLMLAGTGNFTSEPEGISESYYSVEPFQCDQMHAAFYVLGEALARGSNGFAAYISSGPPISYDYPDQIQNILSESMVVNLPDGSTATLYKYVDFIDAGYEDISATFNFSDIEFEWYELG